MHPEDGDLEQPLRVRRDGDLVTEYLRKRFLPFSSLFVRVRRVLVERDGVISGCLRGESNHHYAIAQLKRVRGVLEKFADSVKQHCRGEIAGVRDMA